MSGNKHDVFISFSFKDQEVSEYVSNRLLNTYRISYWMCTRDLLGGEHYKERIVNAIDNAGIVVMIQSENSLSSYEVPKEVALALERKKPVIPFVLDNAELQGDLEYDLIGIHRVDARRPTLDERIEELATQIYAMLAKKGETDDAWAARLTRTKLLPTATIIPKKIFCGRDKVLEEISTRFSSGERVIFLHGIGGIGKTQIAKQFVNLHSDKYDTVVFATYSGTLRDMIISDAPFTLEPEMSRFTMSDGTRESDSDFFARKLSKIQKICDERTLIVIDNFDVDDDEGLKALCEGKYHLLITTRCDYSRFYPTIKIDSIDAMESLIDIFMQNYGGYDVEEDDPDLPALIELVNRHTYTVELLAQHMENSGQTVSEMIEELKNIGISSLTEMVQGEDMQKHTAYENLTKMFKIFSLDDEQKRILTFLSFMPIDGINVRNFRQWAHLDSTKEIKELESRSWLIKNTEGIALHPVIRDVVRQEIPANAENCGTFLDEFTIAIEDKKMWAARQCEKSRYSQISKNIMARFPEINADTEDFYYFAQCLFSFNYERQISVELADRLYDYYLETYGENAFKTARAAFKRGWINTTNIYADEEYIRDAIYWLEMADRIFSSVELITDDEISRHTMTKTSLAKMHLVLFMRSGDKETYKAAKRYAEDCIRHAEENFAPGSYHYAKVGGGCMQLAEILLLGNENEAALNEVLKAERIIIEALGPENSDMGLAYFIRAKAYRALGEVDKMISFAQKGAESYAEYFSATHPNVHALYLLAGDGYAAKGECDMAREYYAKALSSAELIFAPDARQIIEIQEKIKAL